MKYFVLFFILVSSLCKVRVIAQTSITSSDTVVAMVMMGNYNPASFAASTIINSHDSISNGVYTGISADSLRSYLNMLKTFNTRNSASDTVSSLHGIGAARRWALSKFRQFSSRNENRLLPAYLQFDINMCGVTRHRNVIAVLPGMDTTDKSVIIIEGHIDSRTVDVCDTATTAQGMEDNGSGTALVLELARVMSWFSFNHTIVFMITTGEEQGLYGGQAMATYAALHGIKIKAVLNNDVIGGIICGHTSSAPSCPGAGDIDSTHVRLFSYGGFNSFHKGLSRYIKLEYNERILPVAAVPMGINIMTPEDRTGRGGDHIPFRTSGFTAMRFTAANEDGNANVTDTSYIDRQHTSRDSLGIDIDGDGILDTFWVNFNYLARNTIINGNAAGIMGISPQTPDFNLSSSGGSLTVQITLHPEYLHYKVGVRSLTYDWDSVYEFSGSIYDTINVPPANYIVSVCSVDSNGVESLFSRELMLNTGVHDVKGIRQNVALLQNKPNPSDEATMISVVVNGPVDYKEAYIKITDLTGKEIKREKVALNEGVNELMYYHGYHATGSFIYTLIIDGVAMDSKRMTFVN